MWVVTEFGFFSFVVDRKDPSVIHLRARLREDLERNFPDVEVYEKPGADYLFRAKVSRAAVAGRIAQMVMDTQITGHFKDVAISKSATPKHGSRRNAYYDFWSGLAKMQPYAPYSKTPRPEPVPYRTPYLSRPSEHGLPAAGTARRSKDSTAPQGLYGGLMDGNQYGRDYVWGDDAADGASAAWDETRVGKLDQLSDEEYSKLTAEELDAMLDADEAYAQAIDRGDALPPSPSLEVLFRDEENAYPAPVVRDWRQVERDRREADKRGQQSGRRGRRGRKNRHDQRG